MSVRRTPNPDAQELESIETELLLRAVQRRYGYDFSRFDPRHLSDALERSRADAKVPNLSRLTERLLREPGRFERLVERLAGRSSGLFEPAPLWRSIRKNVAP